ARATSARCCSAARRLFFFEGDVVSLEKSRGRALAGSNPPLAQFRNGLLQGQVRLFGNESQYLFRMPFQPRNASSTRFRRTTPAPLPPPHRPPPRSRPNPKPSPPPPPHSPSSHPLNPPPPKENKKRLRHPPPHKGKPIPKQSPPSTPWETPPIQIGREIL